MPPSKTPSTQRNGHTAILPPVVPVIAPLLPPQLPDLSREYVSGGGYNWHSRLARTLPPSIDDITSDFGEDLYARMLWDPTIAKCLSIMKASILEDGAVLASAIEDESNPDYKLAMAIRDEAELMLDDLETSFDDVLWNLCDHIAMGNVVAEQRYELKRGYIEKRELWELVALKPKPRRTYAFVVDAYYNVIGLLGQRPGQSNPYLGQVAIDPIDTPNMLPRTKFAIATWRPHNSDPRGTSILRPVYDAWWRKRQLLPEYLKYLVQFGSPSIWATTPEHAQTQPPLDSYANPQFDPLNPTNLLPPFTTTADNPVTTAWDLPVLPTGTWQLTPEQQLTRAIMELRNGTAASFPFGTVLHALEMTGDGRALLDAKADCDHDIVGAILTQSLATEEGAHQARAAAQVHQDVLDTLIRQGKRGIVRMIRRDILRPWVTINWGEKALNLIPQVTLGTTEEQDRAPLIQAMSTVGYTIHPSQLPTIDEDLGLPVRDLTMDEPIDDGSGGDLPKPPMDPTATGQPGVKAIGAAAPGKPVPSTRAARADSKPAGRAKMADSAIKPTVGRRTAVPKKVGYSAADRRALTDVFDDVFPEMAGLLDAKVTDGQ